MEKEMGGIGGSHKKERKMERKKVSITLET